MARLGAASAFGYLLLLLLQVLHAQDEDESSLHLFICLAMHPAEKIGKKLLVVVCYVSSHRVALQLAISCWSESGYQVWRSLVGVKLWCVHAMLNYRSCHWRIGAICISLGIMGSINLTRILSLSRRFLLVARLLATFPLACIEKWTENLLCDHYRILVCASAATFP